MGSKLMEWMLRTGGNRARALDFKWDENKRECAAHETAIY